YSIYVISRNLFDFIYLITFQKKVVHFIYIGGDLMQGIISVFKFKIFAAAYIKKFFCHTTIIGDQNLALYLPTGAWPCNGSTEIIGSQRGQCPIAPLLDPFYVGYFLFCIIIQIKH